MGVLTDYFRAPGRVNVLESVNGVQHWSYRDGGFDGIELKAIDPRVLLGKLVAVIVGVDWSPDLVEDTPVYPSENPPDSEPRDDDPWATGPWITELSIGARQKLASVDTDRIAEVASVWAESEEFGGYMDAETAAVIIEEFRGLALRAEAADELLYCWICL